MKNYNNFLIEQINNDNLREDTILLSDEDTVKIILEKCKNFDINNIKIHREFYFKNIEKTNYLIDPKKIERKSANTDNYYTYIIDNSKDWEKFPKRKNSLICSVSNNGVWRVIPFDNAKFGICPKSDLWNSFHKLTNMDGYYLGLADFNILFKILYKIIVGYDLNDNTKEIFFDNLDILSNKIKVVSIPDFSNHIKISEYGSRSIIQIEEIYKYLLRFDNMRVALEELFKPDEFNISDYDSLKPNTWKEVWTDSTCILIHRDNFENIFKLLKKIPN